MIGGPFLNIQPSSSGDQTITGLPSVGTYTDGSSAFGWGLYSRGLGQLVLDGLHSLLVGVV